MTFDRISSRALSLALAAALAASIGGAALAQNAAPTLGDQLQSGQISQDAFTQLVAGSGVSADEARGLTLSDLVTRKWADY